MDDVYVLDDRARKQDRLVPGKVDIVLEAHDRDDDTDHNFELGSIAFQISDVHGEVLRSSPRCFFEHLYDDASASSSPALKLLDFGNARHQIERGEWFLSDIDDRERTFRYALTQFHVDQDGRCQVYDDPDGYLQVPDEGGSLLVRAKLWDHSGNTREVEHVLKR